jgi:ribosomal protein S12 methylthiotransferase accessory factor
VPEIVAEAGVDAEFAEVLVHLGRAGALREGPAEPGEKDWARFISGPLTPDALANTRVVLVGDRDLIELVRDRELMPRVASIEVAETAAAAKSLKRDNGRSVVVVALRDRLDAAYLAELDAHCGAVGAPWAQFHLAGEKGWAGPIVTPDTLGDYSDVLARRRCAADDEQLFEASIDPERTGDAPYRPPPTELVWMLSILGIELERWMVGAPSSLVGNEVELDSVDLSASLHPVLPWPGDNRNGSYRNDRLAGADVLVDARTGLITSLKEFSHNPAIPARLTTVVARVADTTRLAPWAVNSICGGSRLEASVEDVTGSAIGEALERYCGNWIEGDRLTRTTYDSLRRDGHAALDPAAAVLYSDRQYESRGFPFVRFDRDLPVLWIEGWSQTRHAPAWVPASFVYVSWFSGPYHSEPPTNYPFYSGIACGQSWDDAVRSGLEEVIERDATMIWWANLPELPALRPTARLDAFWEGAPWAHGQRGWLIPLDNSFGVPVVAGIVEHTAEQLLTTGFAARPDPMDAALKAWSEALTSQETALDLLDPDGVYRRGQRSGVKGSGFIKPWRADRRYLDSFRADFRDVGDLESQAQVYLDPDAVARASRLLDRPRERGLTSIPALPDGSIGTYQHVLEQRGFEIFVVDVTTADVAATGMKVVRVIVPGLVPNFPAAFPFLGRRRIQDEAVALGWREAPLAEGALNQFPLPHA